MTAATAEFVSGMDDCRLKPPMLRSVVRDRLPDEKRPFPSPAELAAVLFQVRTHGLLSERDSDTAGRKLVEAWRSAVDTWVERIVSLTSSSAPDKCWAGSCLLGVTCEECCSDRFQSSYTIWFQKLLENIQSPSATHIIKVACCASLADLFTRLASFPDLKKDGTLFARKVIQPALQMLNEEAEETCWDVAANLLCTLLSLFPSSIQQHYDNVEAVLTSKIMAANCNLNTSKKISRSLAMLPKVKGDGDSWSLLIQKILIAINYLLTDAFQGLEEEKKSSEVMKSIVPPGKDLPDPLGGRMLSGEASESATRRLSELLVPRVTNLMHSCCIMLTNPYPFPVLIPARPLLATVGRVLQVDGSFGGSLFPLITSMHQELLCAELPALHLGSLDLLIAIIKGLRRWAEWNGKYRDDIRRFVKGDIGMKGSFATRVSGSADLYQVHHRKPYHSVNFVIAHDGFTLYDLVSYNFKHNDANGEGGNDGCNDNFSWNCGFEGETDDISIRTLRARQMKNFHVALMISQGTPMMLMGDEYGHTRLGNNNSYGHDTSINHFQWEELEAKRENLFRFFSEMIEFRHTHPILKRDRFLEKNDVTWHEDNWDNPESRLLAFTLHDDKSEGDLYVAFNAHDYSTETIVPSPENGRRWHRVVDTNLESPKDFVAEGVPFNGSVYNMAPYSSIILKAKP